MTRVQLQTAKGNINVDLFDKEAPGTVANFVKLVGEGFYDGLTFHRVIPNFVIQGGCPNTREGAKGMPGTGGPGYQIKCETDLKSNPHRHELGALSMAHAGKNTGGSQFFVVNGDKRNVAHLDGVHTVFGKCEGEEDIKVVMAIQPNDRIVKAVVLED